MHSQFIFLKKLSDYGLFIIMNLGISLLCKLGLTESEAEHINDQENTSYVFARDQGGIGYTYPKLSLLPDLDSTFARLAAVSSLNRNEAPKL